MCTDCGCAIPKEKGDATHHHSHDHTHPHPHDHNHDHPHDHSHTHTHDHDHEKKHHDQTITRLLDKNERLALDNKVVFEQAEIFVVNLMSSPGAGKTSLLEKLAELSLLNYCVIEGDLETEKDAERLRKKGVTAIQITTGQTCHLDAAMVKKGMSGLDLPGFDFLFIENVGNLVCPAAFSLGSHLDVVLLSLPEGADKPAKYPVMFRAADMVLFTKTDLAEHFDFDIDEAKRAISDLNPHAKVFELSTKNEETIREFSRYLSLLRAAKFEKKR